MPAPETSTVCHAGVSPFGALSSQLLTPYCPSWLILWRHVPFLQDFCEPGLHVAGVWSIVSTGGSYGLNNAGGTAPAFVFLTRVLTAARHCDVRGGLLTSLGITISEGAC